MNESFFFIASLLPELVKGLQITLEISLVSFILGLGLAVILLPLRIYAPLPFSTLSRGYVELFRGTPLLVQLLLIYFGLPSLGLKLDAYTACVIAISLNSAAYQSEILRSAVKSIPEMQFLAAESLGFSTLQTYRHVILPQTLRTAIPALVNEMVTLVKESSLASVLGVVELTRRGEYLVAYTFRALEVYVAVALIYLAACTILSQAARGLEKKLRIPGYEKGVV
ncbi:MAG: amino acid ABC transporter permease [Thermofilaceae archaeon]|nr:amino acid ABC transporter permease [Thermofilaceae archaeon]MCX8180300.1 amino acid ABC transporter permease [Thermofilaceae archaeon]MDW8003835.1 amino acid ABC transporter permease [Thermofilaceae archaeon]